MLLNDKVSVISADSQPGAAPKKTRAEGRERVCDISESNMIP